MPQFAILRGAPQLYGILAGAASLFVVFGLITLLSHFCRSAGKSAERGLFKMWGGKPTTALLRHQDTYLESITKERYHRFLAKNIDGWIAPSTEEENIDPIQSDKKYDSAVRWLLEFTRDKNTYSLLFKENINYGFRRNCYGIKWLAVVLAILPLAVIIANIFLDSVSKSNIAAPTTLISICLSVFLLFWWIVVVRQSWVRDAANSYAIRLLAACEDSKNS